MSRWPLVLVSAALVCAVGAWQSYGQPTTSLKPVASFAGIADSKARSVALFEEAGKVIQHPRCVNCHPASNTPLQGDDGHPHKPPVVRGPDNFGSIGMRCTSCHGSKNFAFDTASVPGNPKWHLAPIEMAWAGKSLGAICEQIKDKSRNGNLSMPELVKHMADDELVGWAWHPGKDREPAPGTQKEFGELIKAWAETGAACPAG